MPAPPAVRWVNRLENEAPLLLAVFGLGGVSLAAVVFAATGLPVGTHPAVTVGVMAVPLAACAYGLYRVIRRQTQQRSAGMKAAADRLGLAFADVPPTGDPLLPADFPLAKWVSRFWSARERQPRNVLAGSIGGRSVLLFDQRYPHGKHQIVVTAAYLPDPIPGLADAPTPAGFWTLTGRGAVPAELTPVFAKYPELTIETRGGRVLVYRDRYTVHPDGLADFLALAGRVYAELAATAER